MVTLHSTAVNHPSSNQDQIVVSDHIANEVGLGHMVGPISTLWRECIHTSPIGLIPKPYQVGRWWLITDLSASNNQSVNDGTCICKDIYSLRYASVDDTVAIIRIMRQTVIQTV